MFRRLQTSLLCTAVALLLAPAAFAQQKEFEDWPSGTSPQGVGKRVAERFLVASTEASRNAYNPPQIHYAEAVTWYGALSFAQLTSDHELAARLITRLDPLFALDSRLIPTPDHVDNTVFAAVPLQMFIQTKERRYLDLGMELTDKQWANPTPDGLTDQTRFWIDDMYMITLAQVQAYRATNNPKYLDHAALEMTAYLDKLQQPNGLFYHAPDAPFFWSRGNGWVAAGLAELLSSLPANHSRRARILGGYRKMMAGLLKYQGKDGMWRQLIDKPDFWNETSGTAMFTFAMITGVKNGWLPAKPYAAAARKGWLGIVSNIDPKGDIMNVCEGTGKKNDLEYYRARKQITGDLHGQAPILWAASALLR